MRIAVCLHQTFDPATVKVSRSREELDLREAVRAIDRPGLYALEAAHRLREAAGGEVVAIVIGDAGADDAAHEAVAIGADRAVLLLAGEMAPPEMALARLQAAAVTHLAPVDLVLVGEGGGAGAACLASVLGLPAVLDAVELAIDGDQVTATCAGDGSAWIEPVILPAVVSVQPGAHRPRYPHAARIATAWDAGTVETITPGDVGLAADAMEPDVAPGGLVLSPERVPGRIIGGTPDAAAAELLGLLRARGLVR